MKLFRLGSWTPNQNGELDRFVDTAWPDIESDKVSSYLEFGIPLGYAVSRRPQCTMCDFTLADTLILTDGVYQWGQILFHYVGAHKVRLPEPIVTDMLNRLDKLRNAELNEDWKNGLPRGEQTRTQENVAPLRFLGDYLYSAAGESGMLAGVELSHHERDILSDYLETGILLHRSLERRPACTLCDFTLPAELVFTDGVYAWSQILYHYVGAHGAHLPEQTVSDMVTRSMELASSERDESLWRDLMQQVSV